MPESPTVTFEIPAGYSGFLRVVEDPDAAAIAKTEDGFRVAFSEDGVARVKSTEVLHNYFKGRAQTSSGEHVPFKPVETGVKKENALWLLPKAAIQEVYLFLGTKEEAARFVGEHPEIYRTG